MTARDIRYGRQGGRWASDAPRPMPEDYVSPRRAGNWWLTPARYHPEILAREREHRRPGRQQSCAADGPTAHVTDCTCEPPADVLQEEWEGAARMARARAATGAVPSAIDRQALDRIPSPTTEASP